MAVRVIVILLILAVAASLIYMAIPCRTCTREIWEETLWEAERCRFDYCRSYHAAQTGDSEALQRLFEFSNETDAASALGHGCTLIRILKSIGDESFSRCIRRQPIEMRRLVGEFIEAGIDYGMGRNPDEMQGLFPLSHEAAFEGSNVRRFR
jgi:hypothetical protein